MTGSESTLWRRDIVGWSLYDFANTIYSMNIVSRYLKLYVVEDLGYSDSYFDIPLSISMLLAAAILPALGAMSDHSTKKKIFVFLFTLSCCFAVGLMAFVPASAIVITMTLFVIANFCYHSGQPFYNALLYSIADGARARFISGVGVAVGYAGTIFGLLVVGVFVGGSFLSFDIPFIDGGGKKASFLPTALLFLAFSIPLLLWVKESSIHKVQRANFFQWYKDVWEGIRNTRKYPGVLRFLIADFFFEDAVWTVIINIGLYCSVVIGLDGAQIDRFLIISTVSALFGSFLMGKIAEVWSLKKLMVVIAVGWTVSLALFVFSESMTVIWILGSLVGVLMGGLWTVSRPLLAELVPREELGRFFGLFALSGRGAAIIGPLIWTTIVTLFQSDGFLGRYTIELLELPLSEVPKLPYKAGVLSLAIMMLVGLFIFRKVPETRVNRDG